MQSVQACRITDRFIQCSNYVDQGVTVQGQITDIGPKYGHAAGTTTGLLLSRPIVFKHPLYIYLRAFTLLFISVFYLLVVCISIMRLMTAWRITGKIIRTTIIVNYTCTRHRPLKIRTDDGLARVRELGSIGIFSFYTRKQLLLSVHLSHRYSVCPSVRHTGRSVKNGAS